MALDDEPPPSKAALSSVEPVAGEAKGTSVKSRTNGKSCAQDRITATMTATPVAEVSREARDSLIV
jgi:hypothetical protein